VQDTETLCKQIADEMAKESKLRRTPLTAESVKILASSSCTMMSLMHLMMKI